MIGITVAIVVLLWLYQDLDIAKFLSSIATADLVWIIVLGGAVLLEQLIRVWKWRQILFIHFLSIVLMVGFGPLFLFRSGVNIREAHSAEAQVNVPA